MVRSSKFSILLFQFLGVLLVINLEENKSLMTILKQTQQVNYLSLLSCSSKSSKKKQKTKTKKKQEGGEISH